MKIGKKYFDLDSDRSLIMGILNVTPDSFSDGGKYLDVDSALFQAEKMIRDGADIIDVGGESTRPGYTKISCWDEIARINPVVKAIKERFDVPVSVDTYKWEVAEAVIESGADMINDIWGLDYYEDKEHKMAKVVAAAEIPVCIMHNKADRIISMDRISFEREIIEDMKKRIKIAEDNGIYDWNIILDPGVGFAKNFEENMWCISLISQLKKLGYPVLLGISNKSLIGNITGLEVDQRKEGTIALNVLGREFGGKIFRVHDVLANKRALVVADSICG
ncbi:MAG: dihydropteroate synthase [Butyrivibrio sp.]|jgi:dihydropteroate synthase|uniref:Dihydropteroate synthase n=1 Tax=Butyrivibrio hungatei TaxID=185008 RepID=A0A1G5E8P9_9FIRM|nr:dihydropteroate synthase [Butyrivibrio hungatei]MBQ4219235.1 dihydropteroate synthase [Butyrivibrio sp.]MCR4997901.1 dihydropteroate synthase [Butyrivibrio sp.]SCY22878.1 dihydropteroate synthase [Butyrivibrio hungatei]